MSNTLDDSDDWRLKPTDAESVEIMYIHESKPVLLRVDSIDNLDGQYHKVTMKVTRDHPDHAHEQLFQTPILDRLADAEKFMEAIAAAPMRYGRKFFKIDKVKK